MAPVLFTIYLIAACFFITRIRFIRDAGLGTKTVIILFLIKIAGGCALGMVNYFWLHNQTDYDFYNLLGVEEHYTLFSDPHKFFTDIFRSNYADYGEYFGTSGSYWNDLRLNIIAKVLGIMDIFSRGNYYINSLFFNFLSFFGHIALYRVFSNVYPGKKWQVIVGCFLLPSMLYFSSGIHKDLIIFTALGIFCYCLYYSLQQRFTAKRIIFLLLSFLTVLLIRNFIAVILLPCAVTWIISKRYSIRPAVAFTAMLLIIMTGVVALHAVSDKYDPLKIVADRQQAFLSITPGSTQFYNDTLQPTVKSFVHAAPGALRHSFLSPYPGEFSLPHMYLFSAELYIYILLFLLMLIFYDKRPSAPKHFIWFAVIFAMLVFLFTGYISTAAGALVRYRSIYLPFLMIPVLCCIDFSRLKKIVKSR